MRVTQPVLLTEDQKVEAQLKLLAGHEKDAVTGCWNWAKNICRGYGYVWIGGKSRLAHRVSFSLWGIPVKDGNNPCVLHRCDNRRCINPQHLFDGDDSDNMMDAYRKKRKTNVGTHNPNRKLTEGDIRQIRKMYRPGESGRIAKMFGITYGHAFKIATRRMWAHVPD